MLLHSETRAHSRVKRRGLCDLRNYRHVQTVALPTFALLLCSLPDALPIPTRYARMREGFAGCRMLWRRGILRRLKLRPCRP